MIIYDLREPITLGALGSLGDSRCKQTEREAPYTGPHPLANENCAIARGIRADRGYEPNRKPLVLATDEEMRRILQSISI